MQAIVGVNGGQGIRMGSRQFWDEENDNLCFVTVVKKDFFVTVAAFAVYLYWVEGLQEHNKSWKKFINAMVIWFGE